MNRFSLTIQWRSIAAEAIATFLFVFIGLGAIGALRVAGSGEVDGDFILIVGLAHGLGIMLGVATVAHISGAHLNPAVTVAMWIERFFIVVASLRIPLLEYEPRTYVPTVVELAVTASAFALFGLVIMLFLRFVPIISIWEQTEQHEHEEAQADHEAEYEAMHNGGSIPEAAPLVPVAPELSGGGGS